MKKTNLLKISFMVFFPFVVVTSQNQDAAQVHPPRNLNLLAFEAGDAFAAHQLANSYPGMRNVKFTDESHVTIECQNDIWYRLRLQQVTVRGQHYGKYFWVESDRSR